MYQINDYRASGRTTQLLAICQEENAIFVYPSSFGRKVADVKGYSNVEVMSYDEVLKYGLPKNKKYVIDDLEKFAQHVISGGEMIGYSIEKPIPIAIEALINMKNLRS